MAKKAERRRRKGSGRRGQDAVLTRLAHVDDVLPLLHVRQKAACFLLALPGPPSCWPGPSPQVQQSACHTTCTRTNSFGEIVLTNQPAANASRGYLASLPELQNCIARLTA